MFHIISEGYKNPNLNIKLLVQDISIFIAWILPNWIYQENGGTNIRRINHGWVFNDGIIWRKSNVFQLKYK